MKALLILCILVTLASAQEHENSPWSATISLGGLLTSGNAEVAQVDGMLEVSRALTGPEFTANLLASTSYGSQGGNTYQEKYMTLLNLQYLLTERTYVIAVGRWDSNEFIGISNEYRISAGLGRRLLHGEKFEMSAEVGAGFFNRENTEGERLETSIGYTGLNAELTLTDSWRVSEVVYLIVDLRDSDNIYLESTLEAVSSISHNLSFVLGYNIVHFTIPPVERNEKTDTALRLQLRLAL